MRSLTLLVLAITWIAAPSATGQSVPEEQRVDYWQDIMPLLKRNCLACHRENQAEGGLSLESNESLMRGGDSGLAVVAGHPDQSLLFARISGAEEPLMPPEQNSVGAMPLTEHQQRMLKNWIDQGAQIGKPATDPTLQWQPIPESVRSSYALAVSPNQRTVAVARANRVELVDVRSDAVSGSLVDPDLPQDGVTDLDVVQAIAFSPSGDRIATGGYRTVRIWKRQAAKQLQLPFPINRGSLIALSPDRSELAVVNTVGDIQIWDLDAAQLRSTIPGGGTATTIHWSHSGRLLVGDQAGNVRIYNAAETTTGDALVGELHLTQSIAGLAETSDGGTLAVLGSGGAVRLFQNLVEADQSKLAELDDANAIVFCGDDQLVVGLESGVAVLFSRQSGDEIRRVDHGASVVSLAVDQASNRFLTGGADGKCKLWNAADGALIQAFAGDSSSRLRRQQEQRVAAAEQSWLTHLAEQTETLTKRIEAEDTALAAVVKSRDQAEQQVAESTKKQQAAAEQIETTVAALAKAESAAEEAEKEIAKQTETLKKQRESLAALEKETQAKQAELQQRQQVLLTATATRDQAASDLPAHQDHIRRRQNHLSEIQQRLQTLDAQQQAGAAVRFIALSPSDASVACLDAHGRLRIYDSATGDPTERFETQESLTSTVQGFFLSEHRLLIGGRDTDSVMIDAQSQWVLERTIGGVQSDLINDRVTALDFQGDGSMLAIGSGSPSRSGQVLVVAVDSGSPLRRFDSLHSDTVLSVAFSPDNKILATASADKTIRLIDLVANQVVGSLDGHTHHVLSVAWNHDGRVLASGSADQTIKTWDFQSRQQQQTITGFPDEVTAIRFLADTPQIASVCSDGQVRVHKSDDRRQLRAASAAGDYLFTMDVADNGTQILAAGQQGTLYRWQADNLKPIEVSK
ncbi:hypothetical protein NHH03_05570 [Stieleria sp. TO1_6]|nr:hypothetical protein [Stieleria tagensis]